MTAVYDNGKVMGYIKDITTPAANFMGEYDPNIFYNYGDITMRYGQVWIFDGSSWTCIEESYSEEVKEYITNCPNCGAPMTNHKCAYCGTEDYGRR
jgi:hypothetical protein